MEESKVLKYVNPEDKEILRKHSEEIDMTSEEGKEEARALAMVLMEEVERQNGAAGFSAPQLGNLKRIMAIKTFQDRETQLILVNPEIIDMQGVSKEEEGCFSIDYDHHYYWTFKDRPFRITVKAQDLDGNELTIPFSVADSMIFMHEYEHFFGELIIDNLEEKLDIVKAEAGKTGIKTEEGLTQEQKDSIIMEFPTEEEKYVWKKEHPERKREIRDRGMIDNKDYIVFSDKDGTLDLETEEGCKTLAEAITLIEGKSNGLFVITTARPAGEIVKILEDKGIPVPKYIIGDNGFIYNTIDETYVTEERLPKEEMLDLINDMVTSGKAGKDEIEFSTGDVVILQDCPYTAKSKAYERKLGTRIFSQDVVQSLSDTEKEILSLSLRVSSVQAVEEIREYIENNHLKVQLNYQSLDDGNYSVDLAPSGIHKATSVLKLSQLAINGDKKREDIRGKFTTIGDGTNDITMLTAAYAHGENAVIADKDSEESKELKAELENAIKPYEGFKTGELVELDGPANDYILALAKEKAEKLASKAMRRAVGMVAENGEIPSAEKGNPTKTEKSK